MILPGAMKFNFGKVGIAEDVLLCVSADDLCRALDQHVCAEFCWRDDTPKRSVFRSRDGVAFCVETAANQRWTRIILAGEEGE